MPKMKRAQRGLGEFDDTVLPDPEPKFCGVCGKAMFLAEHRIGLTVWLCPGYIEKYPDHAKRMTKRR